MVEAASAEAAPTTRRPRDRRNQIVHHASELFSSRGFHAVRMEDIAEATGITARALYRHFKNKRDLLSHVILQDQDRLLAALEDARRPDGPAALDELLTKLIESSLAGLRLGPLWQRESRHLSATDVASLRAGTRRIGWVVREAISEAHPRMRFFRSEVRAWAAISIITSPGHYELTIPRRRTVNLLLSASRAAIDAPARDEPESRFSHPAPNTDGRAPNSRRELLLAAAAHAFRRRGFGGVSLDEFGIAGPAVYRYFDSKADLLSSLIARFQDWTALESTRALRVADADTDVITELVRGYVRIALEHTDLLSVAVTEALHLPENATERERRIRTDDIAEWVRWLRVARLDLAEPAAQALVQATRTLINDLVRIPHLTQHSDFEAELLDCAFATLLVTEPGWQKPRTTG